LGHAGVVGHRDCNGAGRSVVDFSGESAIARAKQYAHAAVAAPVRDGEIDLAVAVHPCQTLADDTTAKYESCGIKVPAGTTSGTTPECTNRLAKEAECIDGCLHNLTCDGLTGKDTKNEVDYAKCATECDGI
jgi:hypothetical protein